MRLLTTTLVLAAALLATGIAPAPAAAAKCKTVKVFTTTYRVDQRGMVCDRARALAKQTIRTDRSPQGFKCNFDGSAGKCNKAEAGRLTGNGFAYRPIRRYV